MGEPIRWDRWRPLPVHASGGFDTVPIGPGVYWLRNRISGEEVFIGASDHVAQQMPTLLPHALEGRGNRHEPLQVYMSKNAASIDYRTAPAATKKQALELGARLRAENTCLFR